MYKDQQKYQRQFHWITRCFGCFAATARGRLVKKQVYIKLWNV